jgi:hypothetical protein
MSNVSTGAPQPKGYCRNCGTSLTEETARDVRGILYCEPCLAAMVARPQTEDKKSCGLAAVLGVIPGLGAVYTGEFMKALIYVLIFAAFIGALNSNLGDPAEPILGVLLAAFIVFMAVDACRSAKAINQGQAPPIHIGQVMSDKPVGPLILIGLGVLFLLQQLDVFRIGWIFRYWPVILIAIGAWMLYRRQQSS